MDLIWSEHILYQMKVRNINREAVILTIENPDKTIETRDNRIIYQKIFDNKLLRVISEEKTLITVYKTSKIDKYM